MPTPSELLITESALHTTIKQTIRLVIFAHRKDIYRFFP